MNDLVVHVLSRPPLSASPGVPWGWSSLPALVGLAFGAASLFRASRLFRPMFLGAACWGLQITATNLLLHPSTAFISQQVGVALILLTVLTLMDGLSERPIEDGLERTILLEDLLSAP